MTTLTSISEVITELCRDEAGQRCERKKISHYM
jgi:hypothetical protein